jgi:hypothetical protein
MFLKFFYTFGGKYFDETLCKERSQCGDVHIARKMLYFLFKGAVTLKVRSYYAKYTVFATSPDRL